jgi:hypothetical protein
MNTFSVALIYVAFAAMIITAIVITGTAWPLFALILTPSVSWKGDDKEEKE